VYKAAKEGEEAEQKRGNDVKTIIEKAGRPT
jgi:hypothetical protein